ncbi:MAG: hypothetical protein LQ349_003329 [Xanthoria aureola]|nr:MAG: hypothetical protein LQ349_003329 [Xanthoria aureola]
MRSIWNSYLAVIAVIFSLQSVLALPNQKHSPSLTLPASSNIDLSAQEPSLSKRDWRDRENRNIFNRLVEVNGVWEHWVNSLDIIKSNIEVPAATVIEFLEEKIDNTAWRNEPAQEWRIAEWGGYKISFQGDQGIPGGWVGSYLAGMVASLRRMHSRGVTPANFRMICRNVVTGAIIVVTLSLPFAGPAAAAR